MKKFLSIILALAILIAPVGAVSSFADGRQGSYELTVDTMKLLGIAKSQIITDVADDGSLSAKACFWGSDGSLIAEQLLMDRHYVVIEEKITELKILTSMRKLKCCRARIVFEVAEEDFSSIHAYFYNAQGTLVKAFNVDNYKMELQK